MTDAALLRSHQRRGGVVIEPRRHVCVLYEQNLFDNQGRPLMRTLKEYGMSTIWTAPELEISHYSIKSPATSIGAKGAGSVGTTTVLLAAVEDALRPLVIRVSVTPWNVRRMIEAAARPV